MICVATENTKRCTKCKVDLPLNAFGVNSSLPSGKSIYCYGCTRERSRASKASVAANPREPVAQKRCPSCGETKPSGEFSKNRAAHCGLQGRCRRCMRALRLERAAKNPPAPKYQACSCCNVVLPASAFQANQTNKSRLAGVCKNCRRRRIRAKTYALSDAWLARVDATKTCDICGRGVSGREKHLDHDHKSNLPRGVLCQQCNVMLGMSGDNKQVLMAAAEYLSHFECGLSGVVSNAS